MNGALSLPGAIMLRRCRGLGRLRYILCTGLLLTFALFQFKSSSNEISLSASDVSVRDGRRLFGNVNDKTSVDIWKLAPKDKRLLSKVKKMMEKPEIGDYNLSHPDFTDFSRGQSIRIDNLLQQKKNGFFVEIGASDGESGSVSLYFERTREWDGLLIEPHPGRYRQLRHKHRKATTLKACVRSNSTGSVKEFVDEIDGHVTTPCLWLETILEAIGRRTVDLLSVDARDQEMDILQAIPLSNYSINVITVEFVEGSASDSSVMKYLLHSGYHANHQFVNHPLHRNDMVFTRENLA